MVCNFIENFIFYCFFFSVMDMPTDVAGATFMANKFFFSDISYFQKRVSAFRVR